MAGEPEQMSAHDRAASARLTRTVTEAVLTAETPRMVTVSSIGQEMLPEQVMLPPGALGQ